MGSWGISGHVGSKSRIWAPSVSKWPMQKIHVTETYNGKIFEIFGNFIGFFFWKFLKIAFNFLEIFVIFVTWFFNFTHCTRRSTRKGWEDWNCQRFISLFAWKYLLHEQTCMSYLTSYIASLWPNSSYITINNYFTEVFTESLSIYFAITLSVWAVRNRFFSFAFSCSFSQILAKKSGISALESIKYRIKMGANARLFSSEKKEIALNESPSCPTRPVLPILQSQN